MTDLTRQFLSIVEFQLATGYSDSTIRRKLKNGSLPMFQPGGKRTKILIPKSVLLPPTQTHPAGNAPVNIPFKDAFRPPISSSPPSKRRGPKPRWEQDLSQFPLQPIPKD